MIRRQACKAAKWRERVGDAQFGHWKFGSRIARANVASLTNTQTIALTLLSAISDPEATAIKVHLTIDGQSTTANLIDSPAPPEFLRLLRTTPRVVTTPATRREGT
jgi:hypothetical protein